MQAQIRIGSVGDEVVAVCKPHMRCIRVVAVLRDKAIGSDDEERPDVRQHRQLVPQRRLELSIMVCYGR